jgi:hypothetical protein
VRSYWAAATLNINERASGTMEGGIMADRIMAREPSALSVMRVCATARGLTTAITPAKNSRCATVHRILAQHVRGNPWEVSATATAIARQSELHEENRCVLVSGLDHAAIEVF